MAGFRDSAKDTRGDVECEAVKAGVAEYIADAKGKSKFAWKIPKAKE